MARVTFAPSVSVDLAPLKKKHRKLTDDLLAFCETDLGPFPNRRGVGRMPIPGLLNIWKTRMGIPSANIGARGGLRLIYFLSPDAEVVVVLRAYAKNEIADLPRAVMAASLKTARPLIEAKCRERGMGEDVIATLFPEA